jgi:hypothetical protein
MRADMHKVLTRRQSRRSKNWRVDEHKGECRRLGSTPLDELPFFKAMSSRKGFRTRRRGYAPLRKYVASQVGRLWSEVQREICAHNDWRCPAKRELRQSVDVEEDVVLIAGVPHGKGRWSDYPLQSPWVHPETGILMPNPKQSINQARNQRCRQERKKREDEHQWRHQQYCIDKTHRLVYLDRWDGTGWFIVTLKPLPQEQPDADDLWPNDVVESCYCSDWEWTRQSMRRRWGAFVYAAEKHRANNKTVRRFTRPKQKPQSDQRVRMRSPAPNRL